MLSRIKSWFGVLSTFQINIFTMFKGEKVGTDMDGNVYYRGRPQKGSYRRERRWVIYNGPAEASRIPPEWHGWLHHQTDLFPDLKNGHYRQNWQKPHKENMTGTSAAYMPKGHRSGSRERAPATGDYQSWTPPQ